MELRLKIWHLAFPLFPRIIEVKRIVYRTGNFPKSWRESYQPPHWIIMPDTFPTLLRVNRESRQELSSLYHMEFDPIETRSLVPNLTFNPSVDTIFIHMRYKCRPLHLPRVFEQIFGADKVDTIKESLVHIAGNGRFWRPICGQREWIDYITEFQALEQITFVAESILNDGIHSGKFIGFEECSLEREEQPGLMVTLLAALKTTLGTPERRVGICKGAWKEF